MASFKHGITVTEVEEGARTLSAISTAIIGIVATADDADATTFPLDRPALVTDVEGALGKAGSSGTLRTTLQAIADQTRPLIVVVRVEEDETSNGQDAKVIGTTDQNGQKSGMQALLAAQAELGVKPKILATPGLESEAVTTALAVLAPKLRAFAYARALGATVTEATLYRASFAARELMLLMPDFTAFDPSSSSTVTSYAAARAVGLRALIDEQAGPQKTLSNIPVAGVLGLTSDIHWDIEDMASDAGVLNAAQVTALVRTTSGFRFWGNRTCADDGLFVFESGVRVAQLLAETIIEGMVWAVDKPLTPSLAKDIIETVNGFFRQLKASGVVLGANAWFDPAQNDVSALKAGKLRIDYDYTVPPPLEDLGFTQRITDVYFHDFASSLTATDK